LDLATIIGFILALASICGTTVMEKGNLLSLLNPSAALIVYGGTLSAILVSFPLERVKAIPSLTNKASKEHSVNLAEMITILVNFSEKARREGLLALENDIQNSDNEFLKKGLQLIVDGTDPELIKSILETELVFMEKEEEAAIAVFESAGGYSPTLGIIGTVMGLISVLNNLSNPSELGHSIATAFVATLYGVATANLFWLPVGNKLKIKAKEEILLYEMILEGILSIQAGNNPRILEEKLKAFITDKDQKQQLQVSEGLNVDE